MTSANEPRMLPELDEPPKRYVDPHDVLEQATPDDHARGEALRERIDIDDDEDAGDAE